MSMEMLIYGKINYLGKASNKTNSKGSWEKMA